MLLRCIRAENRKLRGSAIWLVFFVVPLISCLYGTVNFLGNQGMLSFTWYDLWTQHTLLYALFFFAPMVGVYAAYLWRLEHLGRNWNLIMSAPVRPLYLFAAKALALIKLVAFTQGWVFLLFLLCGRLWARLPGWPPAQIFLWLLRGVAGSLPIVALELGLAMAIRSFAVPVLLGLAGGVSELQQIGGCAGRQRAHFLGRLPCVDRRVLRRGGALAARAGRGGIKRGGFFRLLAGFLAADAV